MNSLIVLKEPRLTANSGAKDIARHLYERMYYGKVVIVADKPKVFVGVLRKQWLILVRRTQIERARTLNPVTRAELDRVISYMMRLRFTRRYPPDEYPGDVYIVSVEDALLWPPECSTMCIAGKVEQHKQYLLSSWMRPHSLVVIYDHPN